MATTGGTSSSEQSAGTAADYARPEGLLALLADPETALGQAFPMPRIGSSPPKEFRAFAWGPNATTKGILRLTPEGAQQVMDEYRARGVVKCFDYLHSTYNPAVAPSERKAAGQFRLDLRSDGLWFVDIQWTPSADAAIRAGEWPYISPAVLHTKDGVITRCRNAGLVTDPGLIGAVPTVLSDSGSGSPGTAPVSSPKRTSMADKKRMVLDAYSACETTMKRAQALADTDGAEMDLGNHMVHHMAPMMDKLRAHMGQAGYMDGAAMASKSMAARDKMMSTLEAELNESDPEKLHGKLLARLLSAAPAKPAEGMHLSDSDESQIKLLLLDGYRAKYPTAKRASLEALPLPGVVTFLSAASDIIPMSQAPREAAPIPPTSANVEKVMRDAPLPAGVKGGKPTSYAECSAEQRAKVDQYVETERRFMAAAFSEQVARDTALTLLSDYEPPSDAITRHMPPGGVEGRPPARSY